ncbi:nucleotidyltransferase family protein [Thiohalorhabdus denitrificans]|uniref:nucleotidyltransferase family protein n=1 Tax=Thiohalorhabdus denitrificans TaxID=381306 RepID=UPI001E2E233F|nr:nucleotidyltransferase domain-containing protein [Thiohalorhabdus denitrificans]
MALLAAAAVREELGPGARVVWFGSWPRGQARPRSDLDLGVERDPAISPGELAKARERLEDLPTLYSVDLVDLGEAGPTLREEVEREGMAL